MIPYKSGLTLHSRVDFITNSSSEVFIYVNREKAIEDIKQVFQTIFDICDVEGSVEDYFDISLSISEVAASAWFRYGWFDNPQENPWRQFAQQKKIDPDKFNPWSVDRKQYDKIWAEFMEYINHKHFVEGINIFENVRNSDGLEVESISYMLKIVPTKGKVKKDIMQMLLNIINAEEMST